MCSPLQATEQFEKFEAAILQGARMAEFIREPNTEQAHEFVAALVDLTEEHESHTCKRVRKRQNRHRKSFTDGVGAFSADLLIHSLNEDALGFMYRPANRVKLSTTLVTSDNFDNLVKCWEELGLIEVKSAQSILDDWNGQTYALERFARRFRSTDKFLTLASKHGLVPSNVAEHFKEQPALIRTVSVRLADKDIDGDLLPKKGVFWPTQRMEEETHRVDRLNDILARSGFDFEEPPQVYRLFHRGNYPDFDFNYFGRFQCRSKPDWMNMKPEKRALITCKGEPTVEIDVTASHISILSGKFGYTLPPGEDPYYLSEIPDREIVKQVVTTWFGLGKAPKRWPQDFAKKYRAKTGREPRQDYTLKRIVELLAKKHPVLKEVKPGKLDWAYLNYWESEAFLKTMLELGNLFEVGALPVHDSLIIAEKHEELAKDILAQKYKSLFGFWPDIKRSR